jgi:hypothetical protein
MKFVTLLFTEGVKRNHPLRGVLGNSVLPLLDAIRGLRNVAELDRFVTTELTDRLQSIDWLRLGPTKQLPAGDPRPVRSADWPPVFATRYAISIDALGDPQLFGTWPTQDAGLIPVDADNYPASGLTIENREEMWNLDRTRGEDGEGKWVLRTYFDLTVEEELSIAAGKLDLMQLVLERRSRMESILAAINAEISEFFEKELPRRASELLDEKRRELATREAVVASLNFPEEWTMPTPELDEIPVAVPEVPPSSRKLASEPGEDLMIHSVPRLAPKSFANLQNTIRTWADAIERYPRSFAGLGEDRTSDLLAATLSATMSGAHREVYTRGGKSDIFVHADVLSEGAGPAKVFIIEAKITTSEKVVREALDPQLFGYLTAADTAAVLLMLIPQKGKERAIQRYGEVLRNVRGFLREERSAVTGWPLYIYQNRDRIVRICVAWVHLPPS